MNDLVAQLPTPSPRRIALRVTPDAQRQLRGGHPWVYDQAIQKQSHEGEPGDLAVVFDRERKFLAIGLYDPTSPIRVRILQQKKPAPIDQTWFRQRLTAAVRLRAPLAASRSTTAYRLVHGENDGLPGIIVDRYVDTLVVKLYTIAWVRHLRPFLAALAEAHPARRVILRLSRQVAEQTDALHGLRDPLILHGPPLRDTLVFEENGLRFEADPLHAQKTGFFLDQRENRARIERLATGRVVLDAFAYTGGFSVYAARGGAKEIVTLDMSQPALAAAQRNMALNRRDKSVAAARQELLRGEVFETLTSLGGRKRRFDLVILDPPAFAATNHDVPKGLVAYQRLTQLGLALLRPGGAFMIGSCSSHIHSNQFFDTIRNASGKVRRPLRVMAKTGHPLDHPIGFREGAYLNALFAFA